MDKKIQSHIPFGFNDNIYHEGNISKVLSLSECKKCKVRSHGKRKNENIKRKNMYCKKASIDSQKDLSVVLNNHGRHDFLSCLLSILF